MMCHGGPLDGQEAPEAHAGIAFAGLRVAALAFPWPCGWYYTDGADRYTWIPDHYTPSDHERWWARQCGVSSPDTDKGA